MIRYYVLYLSRTDCTGISIKNKSNYSELVHKEFDKINEHDRHAPVAPNLSMRSIAS